MGLMGIGHRTESPLMGKPNWRMIPSDTPGIKFKATFCRKVVQIYQEDGARR